MAYYPPTPSFGLPFSLAQQRQAPISSSNPSHNFVGDAFSITSDMEQPTTVPPYSSERDYVNQKTSPVSSSTTNPPTLNTSSAFKAFQQNSALPEVNHHAFGHGGPPPLPMFGQFGNGSLPPPPYPPIPIPQNGFTAYPPPILTGNEYQSLVPLAPPPPGSTRPSSRALNINAPNSSLSHKHLSVGPDREEGELSDAELGQPLSVEAESLRRNESATGNRKQPTNGHNSRGAYSDHIDTSGDKRRETQHRSSTAQEGSRNSTRTWSPRAQQGHIQRSDRWSPATSPRVGSFTPSRRKSPDRSYPDRKASTTQNTYSAEKPEVHRCKSSMSNQSNPPQTGRSAKESRTSAKHALLNLFPHKIRFEDITAEGIDEEILKDLYEEVGIKITSQSSRRVPVGDTGQGSASEIALIPNGTINDITPGPERRQAPSRSPLRPDQETNSARSEPNNQLNHSSITSEATNHQRPIIGGPTPKTHSVTTDQVSVTPTEPHLSASMGKGASPQLLPPTPASPPLERKDKIARLLAAKNVKNLSTPTTQKPTSAAHVDAGASKQSQYGATPRGGGVVPDEGTSPDGFVDIDSFSEAPPQVSNNSLRATHAKKRVEVESVRQRVMPSQIETVPQVPQQRSSIRPFTTTSGKLGIRQSSDAETPLEAIKHTVLDDTRSEQPFTEHTTSVRHSKTTIPQGIQVNHTSFSGIPGLFLTSPATAASVSHSHPTTVVEKSTSSEEVVNRRKRPVASDFDPGPISSTGSWKRPFGRSRTDQLIIEVSDDELVDEGGDSGTEFDYGTHQPSAQAQIAQSSQNTTSIRDMPPLTDLTSRRPFSAGNSNGPVSALNTPPVLQKSTSIKESDSLKSKEASIEEMRRKIAAMEQRARAKGSTSRAQTPATPGRASAVAGLASPLVVSSKAIEPSKEHDLSTAEPLQQPKARSTEVAGNTNAEQKAERPAKEAESAVVAIASTAAKSKAEEIAEVRAAALEKLRIAQQEKAKNLALEKEKALEQEKAKAAAFEQHKAAEQERSRLVAAEEQRVQKLERARLEALENQKVKEEEQAKAEAAEKQKAEESEKARAVALEKEKKAQELERARAAVVQRRKVAELEKARIAAVEKQKAADAEKARATEIEKRKLEELKKAQIAALAKQKAEEEDRAKAEAAEQKRQRRAAIESDLPLLDAQVAKQKERLEQLRREMQEAEQKIQRDMKGRRDLVEELESLGVATEGRSTAALQAQKAEILEQRKTGTERIPAANEAVPPQNGIQSPVRLTRETSPFPTSDRSRNQTPPKLGPGVSGIAGHADIAHGTEEASVDNATELEKRNVAETADLMDISDSSAEEGEITDVERQDSSTDEQAKAGARESIPNRLPVSPTEDATESSSQSSDTSVKDKDNYAPDPARVGSDDALKQRQQSTESGTPEVASIVSGLATEREEGQMDSRSVSMDDSDDYEPPEVTPPLTQVEASTPPPLSSPASASPFVRLGNNPVVLSDPPVQTNSIVSEPNQTAFPLTTFDRAIPQAVDRELPIAKRNRFVPYESPLKQFRSFRYHPCFTNIVPGGFRSLTYSHNINESNPVCSYEATGGICNDITCDSQHFRDMGLSDDMILVQMGSVQEGRTPAEVKQYIAGLKQIIQEMRGRKVNDFNTVASEIAAYRTRFLGDKSRVLPL